MLAVISSEAPADSVKALQARGLEVLMLPPHPVLPRPVASHPDMLVFFGADFILCTAEYAKAAGAELSFLSAHCKRRLRISRHKVGNAYPNDILLNALPLGNRLFCLSAHTASELTEEGAYQIVSVKQGYAKCSALPITQNALITEDLSIASAASACGADVLLIASNAVSLPGYNTGFLGGAASFSPYDEIGQILFCGSLDSHPDALRIRRFCTKHGVTPISLTDAPLTDVGTMFLI